MYLRCWKVQPYALIDRWWTCSSRCHRYSPCSSWTLHREMKENRHLYEDMQELVIFAGLVRVSLTWSEPVHALPSSPQIWIRFSQWPTSWVAVRPRLPGEPELKPEMQYFQHCNTLTPHHQLRQIHRGIERNLIHHLTDYKPKCSGSSRCSMHPYR